MSSYGGYYTLCSVKKQVKFHSFFGEGCRREFQENSARRRADACGRAGAVAVCGGAAAGAAGAAALGAATGAAAGAPAPFSSTVTSYTFPFTVIV